MKKITPLSRVATRPIDSSISGKHTTDSSQDGDGDVMSSVHSQTPLNVSISGGIGQPFVASTVKSNPNIQVPQMASFAQSINPMRHTAVVNESLARQEQRRRDGTGSGSSEATMTTSMHSVSGASGRAAGRPSGAGPGPGTASPYPTHGSQRTTGGAGNFNAPNAYNMNMAQSASNAAAAVFGAQSSSQTRPPHLQSGTRHSQETLQSATEYNTNYNAAQSMPSIRNIVPPRTNPNLGGNAGTMHPHNPNNMGTPPSSTARVMGMGMGIGQPRLESNVMTGQPSGKSVLAQTKSKVNVAFMP